ncbi:hypothetical protein [Sphingomonas sp.]|uniref:hypothetical protein n=1 Tax=Sphingomonas sp. TaxID=28214 RepID=UPI001EC02B00|nr:hypothetical protein [Sphingomonas sp.]MBX3593987.1 hypothetical protein [Sphingomonas sp.]
MELRTHAGSATVGSADRLRELLRWMPAATDGAFAVLTRSPTDYIQAILNGRRWVVELRAGGPETHVEIRKPGLAPDPGDAGRDFGSSSAGTLTADEVTALFAAFFEGEDPFELAGTLH